jgi:hypothetical protein
MEMKIKYDWDELLKIIGTKMKLTRDILRYIPRIVYSQTQKKKKGNYYIITNISIINIS